MDIWRLPQGSNTPQLAAGYLTADNRAAFIEKRDNSIRQRLAAAKARKGEPVLQGHDLAGMERFLPETRHMVTVDILNSDSPVGFPGE